MQWEVGGERVDGSTARYGGAERGGFAHEQKLQNYLFSINGIYDQRQGGALRKSSKKKNQNCFPIILSFEKCQPVFTYAASGYCGLHHLLSSMKGNSRCRCRTFTEDEIW